MDNITMFVPIIEADNNMRVLGVFSTIEAAASVLEPAVNETFELYDCSTDEIDAYIQEWDVDSKGATCVHRVDFTTTVKIHIVKGV